jgi:hypothetical protein
MYEVVEFLELFRTKKTLWNVITKLIEKIYILEDVCLQEYDIV